MEGGRKETRGVVSRLAEVSSNLARKLIALPKVLRYLGPRCDLSGLKIGKHVVPSFLERTCRGTHEATIFRSKYISLEGTARQF